jgi:tetratricopeptide (TPR) repeat protein
MSKPMVERYEQILAQDPASTVFVELAKAYIEQGDHARAIDVCKSGLDHHKSSVVGRVLWGKALIQVGRPAEAMEQFDKAIAIDRENPHAYNLISEVLLHKGLYRSAVPLLKKAVALQPNDGRMKQLLEQTQGALAGGPAPVLSEPSAAFVPAPPPPAPAPAASAPAFDPEATLAENPPGDSGPTLALTLDDISRSRIDHKAIKLGEVLGTDAHRPAPAAASAPSARRAPTPGAGTPAREGGGPPVLTPGGGPPVLSAPEPESQPTVIPSPELASEGEVPESSGLLADVVTAQEEMGPRQTEESTVPSAIAERARAAPSPASRQNPPRPSSAAPMRGLLDEIPDLAPEQAPSMDAPGPETAKVNTEQVAREYERDLRRKLEVSRQKKTFLQQHGVTLAVVAVLAAAGVAFAIFWKVTQAKTGGKDLADAIADARKLVAEDTRESYGKALQSLDLAAQMAPNEPEIGAQVAYASALLFAEHGGESQLRVRGQRALEHPGARDSHPHLIAVAEYYLAEPAKRAEAQKALLEQQLDRTEVHAAAGRVLLEQKKTDAAIKRLTRAVELLPGNVRALVSLGNYYREFGDYESSLRFYGGAAEQVSPHHPERVVGAAEARLELDLVDELAKSLAEMTVVEANAEGLPPELLARHKLAFGRVLARSGKGDQGMKILAEALPQFPARAFDLNVALGEAASAAGKPDQAQTALEAAVKLKPKSDEARALLGRALLARDRERELLSRLDADNDARKLSLVRGIAFSRLGDWKRARQELAQTQVSGKFPAEAIIYLALADAAEGEGEKARAVLEKAHGAAKKLKSEVGVALGQLHWRNGALDKAKKYFEEAAKEPLDVEGHCSLGRLLLALGLPEVAAEPLAVAVSRNGSHGEARHALGRAYLALGKYPEGLAQAEAWVADHPGSAEAQRDLAFALFHSGRFKEADGAIARSLKANDDDAEAHRVRAMVAFTRGDPKGGFAALERANKLNAKDSETFCEIGSAFLRQGSSNAGSAFEAARRENAKSACGAIGALYAKLPTVSKPGAKELGEWVKSAPTAWDRAFAGAALARFQLGLGQAQDARASAEAAVALAPQQAKAYHALGLVWLKLRDEAKAKAALTQAVNLDPANGTFRLALADALGRSEGDLPVAVQQYEAFLSLGGSDADKARVKRSLPLLKKKVAQR